MVQFIKFVKSSLIAFCIALMLAVPALAVDEDPQTKLNDELVYHAFFGDAEKVLAIIEQGANQNAVNKDKVPALCLAATRNDPYDVGLGVVKALLASGADIDKVDGQGQSALFYAARVGNYRTVQVLLEAGADFYLKDKNAKMARDIAYDRGYVKLFNHMDRYINKKRETIINQYEEHGKRLVELAKQPPPEAEQAEAKPEAAPEPPPEPEPIDEELFYSTVKKLSLDACAMEYWNYVKRAKLQTPLTPADLNKTIAQHRINVKSHEDLLLELGAKKDYIAKIIRPTQELIFNEIDGLGSNVTRKSHGIGELEDVDKRCEHIADSWNLELPY